MFIIVEWVEDYEDVMLAMDDQFNIAMFKSKEEAEVHARECCSVRWKVVEI